MTDVPVLSASGLTTGYPGVKISEGLDLTIRPGSFTALVGANGSGKSTLMSTLARILNPLDGTVLLDGEDARALPRKAFARVVGMLPQHPSAPEGLTVAELVARGRYPHRGLFGSFSDSDAHAVDSALAATNLVELAARPVGELSGGQRQRVWIAMALAQTPRILMLDEPTSFLDLAHQLEVLDLLAAQRLERGATVVTVLHDLNLAARFADTLVVMRQGGILAEGPPADVLTAEVLLEAFELDAIVIDDPLTGTPMVVPKPGTESKAS
ncbi:MAG TPA: ABC transporter ATP-binding protein [Candidatus Agrococcus pullicola]|uniref:ABC transporter ATP-binding protein n=1 Tax=Candidatus Agrococcus pullicola TaxID=2838429 RepID=A0A9D2CA28_9MICO|nr:ABC transporter ATP-binding protein [Candidatus Agrococcus pullicola]